jgi:predicted HTH transcriptional regulator
VYPKVALREFVANALIHQDFTMAGTGPMVEVFSDRIEITNPGTPLIDPRRFIDAPPQSRNDLLASLMRRFGVCEERGSGIDKAIFYIEMFQLPAPDFAVTDRHTKVIFFAPRKLSEMTKGDKIRACYQHACLQYVSNKQMMNASLRKRFAISDANYSMASRIIGETEKAGLIRPYDPHSNSKRHARYVPYWA